MSYILVQCWDNIDNQRLLLHTHANLIVASLMSFQQPLCQSLLPFADGCQRGWFDGPQIRSFIPEEIHTSAFILQPHSLSVTLSQGQKDGLTTPVSLLPAVARQVVSPISQQVVHNVPVQLDHHAFRIDKKKNQWTTRSLVHRWKGEVKYRLQRKRIIKKNPASSDD